MSQKQHITYKGRDFQWENEKCEKKNKIEYTLNGAL